MDAFRRDFLKLAGTRLAGAVVAAGRDVVNTLFTQMRYGAIATLPL
jgi:hypothetical protein